jgi:hypothetical protein
MIKKDPFDNADIFRRAYTYFYELAVVFDKLIQVAYNLKLIVFHSIKMELIFHSIVWIIHDGN